MQKSRLEGFLWGALLGDAIGVASHWYYTPGALQEQFGQISTILPVSESKVHPDSWNYFQRVFPEKEPFDIYHSKKHMCRQPGTHYHYGLHAGENTITISLALCLMRSVVAQSDYSKEDYLSRYVNFFVEPGQHNDLYIDAVHRHFLREYAAKGDASQVTPMADPCCAAIASALPLMLLWSQCDQLTRHARLRAHISLTNSAQESLAYACALSDLIADMLSLPLPSPGESEALADPSLLSALGHLWHRSLVLAPEDVPELKQRSELSQRSDMFQCLTRPTREDCVEVLDDAYVEWRRTQALNKDEGYNTFEENRLALADRLLAMSDAEAFSQRFSVR